MLLGDRSFLDTDQVEVFRKTGSYHVLVLAGLHVGIIAAMVLWVGKKLRVSLPGRVLVTLAALGAYVAIVEDRAPIIRAALMAAICLCTRLLFRRTAALNVVALAALLILLWRPSELLDPSFLMSFLAAATIAGIAVPLLGRTSEPYLRALAHVSDVTRDAAHAPRVAQFRLDLRALTTWFRAHLPANLQSWADTAIVGPCGVALRLFELGVIGAAVQIGMLPLMAQYFHRLAFVGLAASVPAVLLTGIIVPAGFVALCSGLLSRTLGHLFGRVLAALISLLSTTVNWFARMPSASYRLPGPPVWLTATFFAALVLFAALLLADRPMAALTTSAFAVLTATAALIAAYPFAPRLNRGQLEMTVLDVGQGDSIFVAAPNGCTMLVDGGGLPGSSFVRGMRPGINVGEDVVSPYLWSRGLKRLDVVALTHAHEDHIGGLFSVLRNFRVGELWVGHDVDSNAYRALIAEARWRGVRIVHRVASESFDWGGVGIRVLWPANDDQVRSAANDDSLVLRIDEGAEKLLLAGDIERPVERDFYGNSQALASDFLKVPHHAAAHRRHSPSWMPYTLVSRPSQWERPIPSASPAKT